MKVTKLIGVLSAIVILDSAHASTSLLRRKGSGERSPQIGREEMHVESLIDSLDEEEDWFGRFLQDVSISLSMSLPNKNNIGPNQPDKKPQPCISTEVSIGKCTTTLFLNDTVLCEYLPPIDLASAFCACKQCAEAFSFEYTGQACDELEGCVDLVEGGPGSKTVSISFKPCGSTKEGIVLGPVFPGDMLFLEDGGQCLPDCMDVVVTDAKDSSVVLQTIQLASSCKTDDLLLETSYGSIDFTGYACDVGHSLTSCSQKIVYDIFVCHIGSEGNASDTTIHNVSFNFSGSMSDVYFEIDKPVVKPGRCFTTKLGQEIDRCREKEYKGIATVVATEEIGLCIDSDEVNFP